MKEQRGITLIALIITIIVMLILVGVTVSVALNGGLFDAAKKAASETQLASERETLQAAVVGSVDKDLKVANADTLKGNLPEGWTVTGEAGRPYIATSPKGNEFRIYENGEIGIVSLGEYGFYYNKEYICYNYRIGGAVIDDVRITILEDDTAIIETYQYQDNKEGDPLYCKDFAFTTVLTVESLEYNKEYTAIGTLDSQCTYKVDANGDLHSKMVISKDQMVYSDKTIGFGILLTFTVSEDGLSVESGENIFNAAN